MKYIVTGTPRSSTQYFSRLFTSAGLPMNHEIIYGMPGNGIYESNFIGESSWLAAPFLRTCSSTIIHVIRNPLKVVSSLYHNDNLEDKMLDKNPYCHYKLIYLPELANIKGLDRYLYFYIKWNRHIEYFFDYQFRVEDISKNPEKMFKVLGEEIKGELWNNKETNTNNVKKYLTLEDIKDCQYYDEFVNILKDYNYVSR